jgi:hypothetical protein
MIINEVFLLAIFLLMLLMMMFGKYSKTVVKSKVGTYSMVINIYLIIYSGVRLIRDSATSVGKGFGYVLFQVCQFNNLFIYGLMCSFILRMRHQLR